MARRPTSTPARKRADRYHHGDLRRALLQTAVRTIHSHGVAGLTLRGVGSTLGDQTARAWEDGGRGLRGFEAMGVAYVRFAISHPSHYRVMFGAEMSKVGDAELADEGTGAFQVLVDALTELQQHDLAR